MKKRLCENHKFLFEWPGESPAFSFFEKNSFISGKMTCELIIQSQGFEGLRVADNMFSCDRKVFILTALWVCMKQDNDPEKLLYNLQKSLAKIKVLLTWLQLKQFETRSDHPPAFEMSELTQAGLRNELLFFTLASQELRDMINDKTISLEADKRKQIKQELTELEKKFENIDIPSDFQCGRIGDRRSKKGAVGYS